MSRRQRPLCCSEISHEGKVNMAMKLNETLTSALENRILNQKNQQIDLNEWIFSNLEVNSDDDVLELCCGIGSQTKYFSQKIKSGSLSCVDVNPKSIEKIKAWINNEKVEFFVSEVGGLKAISSKFQWLLNASIQRLPLRQTVHNFC